MRIRSIKHKGLARLIEDDDPRGVPAVCVAKLRRMVSFLQEMGNDDELQTIPMWKAHRLAGQRERTWSLVVTKNWRLTFQINLDEPEIVNLNFEDYH